MGLIRRLLGLFVMLAGLIGLLLSLAGLVGLWIIRPTVNASLQNAVRTLYLSADTSEKTLTITSQALDASVKSVDALAAMLKSTRQIVDDTQPVLDQVDTVLGKNLPESITAANEALKTAQSAAASLEGAIRSIESFQGLVANIPSVGSMLPPNAVPTYTPDKPLADTLGDLSNSVADLPTAFQGMSKGLDNAGGNLDTIKTNLDDMSTNVSQISADLKKYQDMIVSSRSSMRDMKILMGNLQANLPNILTSAAVVIGLFLLWLMAAQVVIFSQGWELYRGTADRLEPAPAVVREEAAPEEPAPRRPRRKREE